MLMIPEEWFLRSMINDDKLAFKGNIEKIFTFQISFEYLIS